MFLGKLVRLLKECLVQNLHHILIEKTQFLYLISVKIRQKKPVEHTIYPGSRSSNDTGYPVCRINDG